MVARLGRYMVLKHLASGGMADVLLGRTDGIEGFERHVVLKRIRPQHAKDERFIRMFLDEARVAASLHHQHIVQVHDIGEADGEFFIAMEYLHGEDVRTLLSNASKTRAHVPLGYAVAIVSAAASGLHYAHERRGVDKRPIGIVHRDVSPSNILVGYDGSIKIVDFGIAKASRRHDTRSGSLKGKVSYMSPEQCRGSDVDRRSDVYSLGVVLYELATTTRLFRGENDYLVMDQIVNGRVSLPQVRRPDLPNELSAIIMKAISPDPERRYFTAEELRIALEQFAARARLAASTAAIGAYLRKQFGDKPEPWLDLDGEDILAIDVVPPPSGGTAPSKSWTDRPRGDRRSSGAIARPSMSSMPSGMLTPLPGALPPEPLHASAPQLQEPGPATPPPTDSKMGWESQRPPSRALTPVKVAMISAPLVVILGVAIWQLAGSGGGSPSPAMVAQTPPPPAPVVTPIQDPVPQVATATVPSTEGGTQTVQETAPPPPLVPHTRPEIAPRRVAAKAAESTAARTAPPSTRAELPTTPAAAAPPAVAASSPASGPPGSPGSSAASTPASVAPPLSAALTPPSPVVIAPPAGAPAAPSTAPAAAAAPQVITPGALDANRIAGEKEIIPDENTQSEIGRSGQEKVAGSFKLCVAPDGNVTSVSQLKSTGFPAYDSKIQNTIRGKWRYKPFIVDGKATTVCTAVRFVYSQK
ncbi:MAG TPA: protein kinase [Kofleriaceae bacterium]|nr:protein kinase [Kofleriaceae bacterium]